MAWSRASVCSTLPRDVLINQIFQRMNKSFWFLFQYRIKDYQTFHVTRDENKKYKPLTDMIGNGDLAYLDDKIIKCFNLMNLK
jgi:hypothetical protein